MYSKRLFQNPPTHITDVDESLFGIHGVDVVEGFEWLPKRWPVRFSSLCLELFNLHFHSYTQLQGVRFVARIVCSGVSFLLFLYLL